jgi:hypothetical protein
MRERHGLVGLAHGVPRPTVLDSTLPHGEEEGSMSNTALTAVVEEIARDPRVGDASVRTQLAFIRSLMDEIERSPKHDARANALAEQLFEEMTRLRGMVCDRIAQTPVSGVQLRAVASPSAR